MYIQGLEEYDGLGMAGVTHMHSELEAELFEQLNKRFCGTKFFARTNVKFHDAGDNGRIPDVAVFSKKTKNKKDGVKYQNPVLTIEITHNKRNDEDSAQSIMEVFEAYPSMTESYIFNYHSKKWIRFERLDDGRIDQKETSKSKLFGFFMNTLVKEVID